jgi:CBS domain-containing protein
MTHVSDVMSRTVVVVPGKTTFTRLARVMHAQRAQAIPVVDDDGIVVGVVSEADLMLKMDPDARSWRLWQGAHAKVDRRKALARTAEELMTSPAVAIDADATLADAAHLMHEHGVKQLPVLDEEGRAVGMVSRVDVLTAFLRGDAVVADDVEAVVEAVVPEGSVRVSVTDGIVHLHGLVQQRSTARHLADEVRQAEGVVDVDAADLDWEIDDPGVPSSSMPWIGV